MPLYVYSCAECEIEIEELRPHTQADWPPVECPICHGLCQRDISLFALQRQAAQQTEPVRVLPPPPHAPDCLCCRPRRR